MRIYEYYRGGQTPVVAVLGFFDCMHVGHAELLKQGKAMAARLGAECVMFTFTTTKNTDGKAKQTVYTLEERLARMSELGADGAVLAAFDEAFRQTSPIDFLDGLFDRFPVVGVVCGDDYRYGAGAKGTPQTLQAYCAEKGVPLTVVAEISDGGARVSSSRVAACLAAGDLSQANRLLGEGFRLSGKVVRGRKVGRTLGFPTANVAVSPEKTLPKSGVYTATAEVEGKAYAALVHVGARPTYGLSEKVVEVWLNAFDGALYDKTLTVHFSEYVRDIVAFDGEAQLARQIEEDKAFLRANL